MLHIFIPSIGICADILCV